MSDHKTPLSLHIPEPKTRPGDAPDFSDIVVPLAGLTRRPAIDTRESEMRDLSFDLIRVLDDDGKAVGEWALDIDPEILRKGLRAMLLTRLFEERMFNAHRQGKTSFFLSRPARRRSRWRSRWPCAATTCAFPPIG